VCPYCQEETCKLCGEESHVPLRCSEVEKKGDTHKRLSVEEAMTQARLRCSAVQCSVLVLCCSVVLCFSVVF
jgi:hypothetical protein